jgi:hypothetical protein
MMCLELVQPFDPIPEIARDLKPLLEKDLPRKLPILPLS